MSGAPGQGVTPLDWIVIAGYLVLALGAGVLLARRSRGTMENFFLSGRSLPWWLAGTSMVATSFASDTPLVVCHWTRADGVAGNWRWWAYLGSTLLVVVLFARFWQRSRVLTDVELMELRYSGGAARFLRGFKALYQAVLLHCFVMGWVILGMTKVLVVLFDLGTDPLLELGPLQLTPAWAAMLGCSVLALVYSEVAGLWGVVATDFVQFVFALFGAVVLMVMVTAEFGGVGALVETLAADPATAGKLSAAPSTEGVVVTDPATWPADVLRFLVVVSVIWFANKNADGSGVMVQRLLASRNERHALLASLWYAVAHFAVRPWPWIVVALASLVVLPPLSVPSPVAGTVVAVDGERVVVATAEGRQRHEVTIPDNGIDGWDAVATVEPGEDVVAGQSVASTDDEAAYPLMMRRFLPAGLLGLLAASFLAAFMSTIDTHVNLASSYLVNDMYRRFLRPDAPAAHYVRAARVCGPLVLAVAIVFAASSQSVRDMFDLFTTLFGGVGLVYLLRWLWWRINAWSEVAALVASAAGTVALRWRPEWGAALLPGGLVQDGAPVFEGQLLLVVPFSFLVVLPVTLLTPPTDREQLRRFHAQVRPVGAWGPLREAGPARQGPLLLRLVLGWIGATVFVMAAILVPWDLVMGRGDRALAWTLAGLVGAAALVALPRLPSRHAAGPS